MARRVRGGGGEGAGRWRRRAGRGGAGLFRCSSPCLLPAPRSFPAVQRSLPPDREVLAVMEAWFEKPLAKFVFQLKLYTETMVTSKDPKVVNMMFIQVRRSEGAAREPAAHALSAPTHPAHHPTPAGGVQHHHGPVPHV